MNASARWMPSLLTWGTSRRPTAAARRGRARSEHFPVCSHAVSRGVTARRDASSIRTRLVTGRKDGSSGQRRPRDHVVTNGSKDSRRESVKAMSRSTLRQLCGARRDHARSKVAALGGVVSAVVEVRSVVMKEEGWTLAKRAVQGRRGTSPLALSVQRLGTAAGRGGWAGRGWNDGAGAVARHAGARSIAATREDVVVERAEEGGR